MSICLNDLCFLGSCNNCLLKRPVFVKEYCIIWKNLKFILSKIIELRISNLQSQSYLLYFSSLHFIFFNPFKPTRTLQICTFLLNLSHRSRSCHITYDSSSLTSLKVATFLTAFLLNRSTLLFFKDLILSSCPSRHHSDLQLNQVVKLKLRYNLLYYISLIHYIPLKILKWLCKYLR